MIPVDDGKTSVARTPNNRPTSLQICSQARFPGLPVAQFALPEFTMTARTRFPEAAKAWRPTSTGAATIRFCVNRAAAVVPGEASTRPKSGRPLLLMPAQAAEKVNPAGRQILFSG